MTDAPERTALYRIHGDAGVLLYIGITNNPAIRWNAHQASQPWWDELRTVTVEWYDSRPEAEAAEKAAILAEQPKYNVTYLKPLRTAARKSAEVVPVESGKVVLEPRADDEDLLTPEEAANMTRLSKGKFLRTLIETGGPRGFTLADQPLFRRGEIRQWVADVEASQREAGAPAGRRHVAPSSSAEPPLVVARSESLPGSGKARPVQVNLYDAEQAATITRTSANWMKTQARAGKIPVTRMGRRMVWTPQQLLEIGRERAEQRPRPALVPRTPRRRKAADAAAPVLQARTPRRKRDTAA